MFLDYFFKKFTIKKIDQFVYEINGIRTALIEDVRKIINKSF